MLHYQPQVDVATGRAGRGRGARPLGPSRSAACSSPLDFIEVAQQTGLIKDLTTNVIDIGLRDLQRWADDGRDLSLSLNISGALPARPRASRSRCEQLLDAHDVSGRALTFEITESSLIVDPEVAKATMRDARATLGVSFAIDDFGTGYSRWPI